MRFIPNKDLAGCTFSQHGMLFLDCWYGLTHLRSLDSHRPKCLNARTILRELCEELELGRLDDPEFHGLCEEAARLLQADSVITSAFPISLKTVLALLERPPCLPGSQKKPKDESENQTHLRELKFGVSDFCASLEARYLERLCSTLSAKFAARDVDTIPLLTNALISDLVSRGWPLESLHFWHRHFFAQRDRAFQSNLDFMLDQLQRAPQEFEVTLRINGGAKLQTIQDFGKFTLSQSSNITPNSDAERSFALSGSYVVFARGTFSGVDFRSAALTARARFESLLDMLRFEFEPRSLKIESRSFLTRSGDGRTNLVTMTNPVPNPVESLDEQDFSSFCSMLDNLLDSQRFDSETKNRVSAAFRQYRFGRDSESYTDKFLNWWMGLETLANVGGYKIGRTTSRNVSNAMLTGYLFRHLRDLLMTLKSLDLPWSDVLKTTSAADSVKELNVPGLVRILQDDQHHPHLWASLSNRPYIVYQAKRVSEWLCDPKKAAAQMMTHRQRLKWHLDRLYRIRCCIVHGSRVRFELALFAANLEYYLKQTLIFTLIAFKDHPHMTDLASLFHRAILTWDRQLNDLQGQSADKATIASAVFSDVVVRD